jgi:hypothetical protein
MKIFLKSDLHNNIKYIINDKVVIKVENINKIMEIYKPPNPKIESLYGLKNEISNFPLVIFAAKIFGSFEDFKLIDKSKNSTC